MRVIFIILFIVCSGFVNTTVAQARESVQKKILQKMRDSLGLASLEVTRVGMINSALEEKKSAARLQYGTQADSLQYHIQRIENTRDSLYQQVLPVNKYLLYKQKKAGLISNN